MYVIAIVTCFEQGTFELAIMKDCMQAYTCCDLNTFDHVVRFKDIVYDDATYGSYSVSRYTLSSTVDVYVYQLYACMSIDMHIVIRIQLCIYVLPQSRTLSGSGTGQHCYPVPEPATWF